MSSFLIYSFPFLEKNPLYLKCLSRLCSSRVLLFVRCQGIQDKTIKNISQKKKCTKFYAHWRDSPTVRGPSETVSTRIFSLLQQKVFVFPLSDWCLLYFLLCCTCCLSLAYCRYLLLHTNLLQLSFRVLSGRIGRAWAIFVFLVIGLVFFIVSFVFYRIFVFVYIKIWVGFELYACNTAETAHLLFAYVHLMIKFYFTCFTFTQETDDLEESDSRPPKKHHHYFWDPYETAFMTSEPAYNVDKYARIYFPVTFAVLNSIYWIVYAPDKVIF